MPRYYTYLVSSLPLLRFDRELPFSYEKFLEMCRDFISEKEFIMLKTITEKEPEITKIKNKTLKEWFNFDFALRNELAKQRASRKNEDSSKYLRKTDKDLSNYFIHLISEALKSSSPLEAERILDRARWIYLEELERGHFFDFDFLVVYGVKLCILERWHKIQKADKETLLDNLVN